MPLNGEGHGTGFFGAWPLRGIYGTLALQHYACPGESLHRIRGSIPKLGSHPSFNASSSLRPR